MGIVSITQWDMTSSVIRTVELNFRVDQTETEVRFNLPVTDKKKQQPLRNDLISVFA